MGNYQKHLFWPTKFPSMYCTLSNKTTHDMDTWPHLLATCKHSIIKEVQTDRYNKTLLHIKGMLSTCNTPNTMSTCNRLDLQTLGSTRSLMVTLPFILDYLRERERAHIIVSGFIQNPSSSRCKIHSLSQTMTKCEHIKVCGCRIQSKDVPCTTQHQFSITLTVSAQIRNRNLLFGLNI